MNNFDSTKIENAVGDAIYAQGVSSNVFANRPSSLERDMSDFVVCHVSGNINDRGAIGECTLFIALYAKDVSNMKNGKKLSVMQTRLRGLDLEIDDPTYGVSLVFQPYTFQFIGDAPDGNGYHARICNLKAFIKIV